MRLPKSFREYAVANDGLFTRASALANGLSARQFRTGATNGEWVRYRGVWILSTTPQSRRTVARAALLCAGPDARLTGDTALSLFGLELPPGLITVSVPAATNRRVSGALLLRDHDRDEIALAVKGMPTISRTRSIIDALRLADEAHGRTILDAAIRRGWISTQELSDWCTRLRCCRGLTALNARLADAKSGTQAESERLLHRLNKRAGLSGWTFNTEIRSESGILLGIGDCVNRELKILIEVDGWAWHTTADRFQRDRDRQNDLVHAGWAILRFTWLDLTSRPDHVIAAIRREIARAS